MGLASLTGRPSLAPHENISVTVSAQQGICRSKHRRHNQRNARSQQQDQDHAAERRIVELSVELQTRTRCRRSAPEAPMRRASSSRPCRRRRTPSEIAVIRKVENITGWKIARCASFGRRATGTRSSPRCRRGRSGRRSGHSRRRRQARPERRPATGLNRRPDQPVEAVEHQQDAHGDAKRVLIDGRQQRGPDRNADRAADDEGQDVRQFMAWRTRQMPAPCVTSPHSTISSAF